MLWDQNQDITERDPSYAKSLLPGVNAARLVMNHWGDGTRYNHQAHEYYVDCKSSDPSLGFLTQTCLDAFDQRIQWVTGNVQHISFFWEKEEGDTPLDPFCCFLSLLGAIFVAVVVGRACFGRLASPLFFFSPCLATPFFVVVCCVFSCEGRRCKDNSMSAHKKSLCLACRQLAPCFFLSFFSKEGQEDTKKKQ